MANGKYHTGSQFDEYFMNAFQFQQEINEKRAQRIQDINFKMRELSLLSDYQQGILEDRSRRTDVAEERTNLMSDELRLDALKTGFIPVTGNQPKRENIRTGETETDVGGMISPIIDIGGRSYTYPEPQAPEQIQTKDPRVGADGYVYRWDENTKEYIKTELRDYDALTRRINATDDDEVIQSPHISSINFDAAYRDYMRLGELYRENISTEGEITYTNEQGKRIPTDREGLKEATDRARKKFMDIADNRADALEKEYKGFEAFYNDFKIRKDLKLDKISEGRLMDIISKEMAGFPADAIREMFELLIKTNG